MAHPYFFKMDLKIALEATEQWKARKQRRERRKSRAGTSTSLSASVPVPSNEPINGLPEHQDASKRTWPLKLYQAATRSDVEHLEQVLGETCEELNLTLSEIAELVTPAGSTLQHVASRENQPQIVRQLAYHSPFLIMEQNLAGDTALHVAVRSRSVEVVTTLLHLTENHVEQGANNERIAEVGAMPDRRRLLSIWNNKLNTAAHESAINDYGWHSSLFTDSDPEIFNLPNIEGKSPLYYAAEAATKDGNTERFNFIINTPTEKTVKGMSPLLPAITASNKGVLDGIISREPAFINFLDEDGKTALHLAASVGSVDIVKYLLGKNSEGLLIRDDDGLFPVLIAAAYGHVQVLKELLRHSPDPREILTHKGQNILHIAAARGKTGVVSFILKTPSLESLINESDYDGNTPLHFATINWHPNVVSALTWDKRVNIAAINNKGFTALDAAEYYMEKPPSFDRRLTWTILKAAKAPRAPEQDFSNTYPLDSTQSRTSNTDNYEDRAPEKDNINTYPLDSTQSRTSNTDNYKDRAREKGNINTYPLDSTQSQTSNTDYYRGRVDTVLLVATLVATITFAAGFTVPGGYSNSPPNEGMAAILQKRAFYVFVFSDTIALYSSVLVAVSLIWAQLGDLKLMQTALRLAIPLLGLSLTMMALAFMVGVYLVVSTLNWLAYSVLIMGSIFLCAHVVIFFPLSLPADSGNRILRYICYYPLQLLILLYSKDKNNV